MEQTHVADTLDDAEGDGRGRKGLAGRASGEPVRPWGSTFTFASAAYVFAVTRVCKAGFLGGLRNKVTFGEDFRNPA